MSFGKRVDDRQTLSLKIAYVARDYGEVINERDGRDLLVDLIGSVRHH